MVVKDGWYYRGSTTDGMSAMFQLKDVTMLKFPDVVRAGLRSAH
jgi:hypothetical protein